MDPSVILFEPSQRDSWGQYLIPAGFTHCIPFEIPPGGTTILTIAHIAPNSQDWSIDFWFSRVPLDEQIFSTGFAHGKASRLQKTFKFVDKIDEDQGSHIEDIAFWDAGVTLWLNVKNLQNSQNAYQAEFNTPSNINPCC